MDYPLIDSLEDIKILLVDDEPFMSNLLEKVLSDLGFRQIIKAVDGQQAIDILNDQYVDLLITDIQMPVMNGLELLKQVRCGNTVVPNHLRSIIITSFSSLDTLGTAIALDVNGFLEKPFKPVTVIKKILKALSEDEASQRLGGDYEDIVTDLASLAEKTSSEQLSEEGNDAKSSSSVSVHMLQPGMKLVGTVYTSLGTVLLPDGFMFTRQSIQRLRELGDVIENKEFVVDSDW